MRLSFVRMEHRTQEMKDLLKEGTIPINADVKSRKVGAKDRERVFFTSL